MSRQTSKQSKLINDVDDCKKKILRRLDRQEIIGERHTAVEYALSGIPRHQRGDAKDAINELIKEGLILAKPTHYGLQVSLNPERMEEIREIVKG